MATVAARQALNGVLSVRGSALIALSEDQWFDRKSSRIDPRKLAESLVAFANAEGGIVVIGLSQGRVEGVSGKDTQLSGWRQAAFDYTDPPVRCEAQEVDVIRDDDTHDRVLVLDIEPSSQVHATNKDEVFLRVGDENRKLTFRQRQELIYDKGQVNFETTPVALEQDVDLDEHLLFEYAKACEAPDAGRLLKARGLVTTDNRVTAGAVLLFADNPQQWFAEATVRVLRYRGSERGTGARQQLVSDLRFDGHIPRVLGEARQAIFDELPKRRALGRDGKFSSTALIPEDAWLEALVNAVVHRSYSISGDHIRVEIFDDRIEVESPGRFPGVVNSGEMPNVARFARNPRIARVCADLRFGQELGEGVRRMFEEMHLAGLTEPHYVQTSGSVRVTLSSAPLDSALDARLPTGARTLVRLIREAGRLSTGELVDASGSSRPTVIRDLKALEAEDMILWVGKSKQDPRAYWTIPSAIK